MTKVLRLGDLVKIDRKKVQSQGGQAYIHRILEEGKRYKVKYVIGGTETVNIDAIQTVNPEDSCFNSTKIRRDPTPKIPLFDDLTFLGTKKDVKKKNKKRLKDEYESKLKIAKTHTLETENIFELDEISSLEDSTTSQISSPNSGRYTCEDGEIVELGEAPNRNLSSFSSF